MVSGEPEVTLVNRVDGVRSGVQTVKIVVLFRAVKINGSVIAGVGIDNGVGNELHFALVGFYLIKFGKIFIVVTLIVDIIAHKLQGYGRASVKTL